MAPAEPPEPEELPQEDKAAFKAKMMRLKNLIRTYGPIKHSARDLVTNKEKWVSAVETVYENILDYAEEVSSKPEITPGQDATVQNEIDKASDTFQTFLTSFNEKCCVVAAPQIQQPPAQLNNANNNSSVSSGASTDNAEKVRTAQVDSHDNTMLEVLTLVSSCTLFMVLSQVLDHKLVLPVDVSGQPLKHELLGAVDVSGEPLKHKLLGAVDSLQRDLEPILLGHGCVHLLDLGLVHDDLPPEDAGQPQPPPLPDNQGTQDKGTLFVFPSVSLAWMASESAMTTSPLVPTLAAALLWRYLHSLIEAVTSADGLPVQHISRPHMCQYSCQDQSYEAEHSVTSSSQEILASDKPFILFVL